MKVALLSFHNAYNYGAALQAYALQEVLSSNSIEAEYINYVNEHRKEAYDMKLLLIRALKEKEFSYAIRVFLGIPFIHKRRVYFESFYSRHLKVTKEIYTSSHEAEKLNDFYDKFVVGSDQVWNPNNNGEDTAYLLDFVRDNRKCISYSPSFGTDSISEQLVDKYKNCLKKFLYIGVREKRGAELIEALTGIKSEILLDPVFLLDSNKWYGVAKLPKNKNFIFFYTNNKDEIKDFYSTGFKRKGIGKHILCTKISPLDYLSSNTKVVVSMPVESFLGEIINSSLVVTSSFHCLAFSIIFHKQFVCVLSGNAGKDERLINLLRICGLENRILNVSMTEKEIECPIDYKSVDESLEGFISKSKEFLLNAIYDRGKVNTGISDVLENNFFCNDDRCTGCGACVDICPVNAISMVMNEEGFLYPKKNQDTCVNCGRCHTVCQVYREKERAFTPSFFCVKNTDEVRMNSSSGGVFPALSEEIFSRNGIVVAAAMQQNYTVRHMFFYNRKDISRACGTFYVQSQCEGIYSKIKECLEKNQIVLFVGLPCQVNALKIFLGKEYSNLYLCDLICHGVPSPMVFEKFIEYLKTKGDLKQYRFRDKEIGWQGYTESAVINKCKIYKKAWLTSFTTMFSHNLINRKSCSQCVYTNINRYGDISIGDFWGIKKYYPQLYDKLGASLVICNTLKGEELLDKINVKTIIEINANEAMQNSLKHPAKASKKRFQTIKTIKDIGYYEASRRYGNNAFWGKVKLMIMDLIIP